jgi:hypothetical protein
LTGKFVTWHDLFNVSKESWHLRFIKSFDPAHACGFWFSKCNRGISSQKSLKPVSTSHTRFFAEIVIYIVSFS